MFVYISPDKKQILLVTVKPLFNKGKKYDKHVTNTHRPGFLVVLQGNANQMSVTLKDAFLSYPIYRYMHVTNICYVIFFKIMCCASEVIVSHVCISSDSFHIC